MPGVALQGSLGIGRPVLSPLERHLANQWEFGPSSSLVSVVRKILATSPLHTIEITGDLEVLWRRFEVGIERLRLEAKVFEEQVGQ